MNRLVPSSKLPVDLNLAGYVSAPLGSPEGVASAGDLWRILWRRRVMILATVLVLVACTLAYCLVATPRYTAATELFIDPRDRNVVAHDVNPTSIASDGGVAQIESQARVIGSSSVLLRAITATHLADELANANASPLDLLKALLGHKPASPAARDLSQDEALEWLKQRVSIKRADRVFVVDVSVSAPTADLAARLVNAISDAYLADQAETRAQAGDQAAAAMSARLNAQRAKVEADANAVEAYKRAHNIVTASGQVVGEKNLIDLDAQLTAAQTKTAALRATIDQIDSARRTHGSADGIVEALQSAVVSKLREQESALVAQQADLTLKFGPRHPSLLAVNAQLANIRGLIGAELNRIARSAHADYDRAVTDQRLLTAQVQKAKATAQSAGQSSVGLRELERDLEADRSVYGAFLTRVQEIREQAGIDTTNARVITRASPPDHKSWPPLLVLLAGALGSGIGLGSGMALLREYARPTILSAGQVERVVGAPVIAVLPGGARLRPSRLRPSRLRPSRLRPSPGRAAAGKPSRRRVTYARVLAMVGIALRRLYHVGAHEREAAAVRSLVIASNASDAAVRRDVCQLFAAAAQLRGERVLLIHADDDEAVSAGLAEILRGDKSLGTVIERSPTAKIATIGTGVELATVAGDVSWNGARQLLADARSQFDVLVIDAGVLEDNLAIAPLLAAAEELIFVAQLSSTSLADVTGTAETAAILGRSISAIVLVDPAAAG